MNSESKVLKSGIWYTVAEFITKGAAFLTTPIFTRLLTPEEVGKFSNFSSWISILAIVCTLDLFSSVNLAKFDFKDDLDDYISSNLCIGTVITGVIYLLAVAFKSYVLRLLSFSELELHVAFIYLLVYPATQMFLIKSRVRYEYRSSVLVSLSSALISTCASLIFACIFSNKYIGRLIGYIVPLIVINALLYFFLLLKGKKIRISYMRYGIFISIPLVFHALAGTVLNSSDRIMIESICGSHDTALYTISYTCAIVVQVLWSAMNTAWSPWAYDQMDAKSYINLRKASKPYMFFFGMVVSVFLLVAPELLKIMGGQDYMSALYVIPPVMVAYVFQFVYSLYVNIEFYHKKQKLIAIGTAIAAGINIALNYLFIPIYGYVAAAYATLIGYIILFLIHYFFVRYLIKTDWYDSKFIFKFLTVFIMIMFLTILLYKMTIIRYSVIFILILCFIFICLYLRNEIISFMKNKSLSELIIQVSQKLHISL